MTPANSAPWGAKEEIEELRSRPVHRRNCADQHARDNNPKDDANPGSETNPQQGEERAREEDERRDLKERGQIDPFRGAVMEIAVERNQQAERAGKEQQEDP